MPKSQPALLHPLARSVHLGYAGKDVQLHAPTCLQQQKHRVILLQHAIIERIAAAFAQWLDVSPFTLLPAMYLKYLITLLCAREDPLDTEHTAPMRSCDRVLPMVTTYAIA